MGKLNVFQLGAGRISFNGMTYVQAKHPIQTGDIVKSLKEDENCGDYRKNAFYGVTDIDSSSKFQFIDDEGDERDRSVDDTDFEPYRKVVAVEKRQDNDPNEPLTIVIDKPVRLVLMNIGSVEIGGVKYATTV